MQTFLQKHLDDVLLITGAILIVIASFLIGRVVGFYTAGIILIVFGVLIGLLQARTGAGGVK